MLKSIISKGRFNSFAIISASRTSEALNPLVNLMVTHLGLIPIDIKFLTTISLSVPPDKKTTKSLLKSEYTKSAVLRSSS